MISYIYPQLTLLLCHHQDYGGYFMSFTDGIIGADAGLSVCCHGSVLSSQMFQSRSSGGSWVKQTGIIQFQRWHELQEVAYLACLP